LGHPASHESSQCFAFTKTWSMDFIIPGEENR
jgi:hypothetical protein